MNIEHLWVVIIAGGKGTRLFPISHPGCPKQFCQLDKDNTFIQVVIENFKSLGIKPTHMMVITTDNNQTALAAKQCLPRGVLSHNILQMDPDIGYPGVTIKAAEVISSLDENAVIINTPSDQYLVPNEDFKNAIEAAVLSADNNDCVIVGVKIGDLNTVMGCGHAIYDDAPEDTPCYDVKEFVEKPNRELAKQIMQKGNSACNTAINIWRAKVICDIFSGRNYYGITTDGLMNHFESLKVAVGSFEWHDCGTLKSLYDISKKTPNHKNASLGGGSFERNCCRRSLFYADVGMELQVSGAEDDAVLFTVINERPVLVIAKLSESQKIKRLAEDYLAHEDILSADFSMGARNNLVLLSNVSDEIIVGFVGVNNYCVYIRRKADGTLTAVVSQPCLQKNN